MGFIIWIIIGLLVGLMAKFIIPRRDHGGIIIAICLGIGGAFIGGFTASLMGLGAVTSFSPLSIGLATLGSVLLLLIYMEVKT